ncbi:MAG: LytTR family transcriptional regulator DNA-binding domain-containing protein [Clostridiales bacterium]|nr:LytTR family transcriptional regulator DNA-binding domain-containing protein [Clostridiales bacterium]
MIRVFIYHSDRDLLKEIQRIVIGYFRSHQYAFRVMACSKYKDAAEYLMKSCEDEDIFMLDFSMHDSALKMAAYIREHNLRASWIYMGGEPTGVFKVLFARPSGYIQKPQDQDNVWGVLHILVQQHQKMEKKLYFSFKYEGELMRIPYEEISHFESSAKKVTLYQGRSNKSYYFTAKLDDIGAVLPDFFLRCHQSYIVNMHMIRSLDTKNHVFVLYSNEEVLISRRMYAKAKELYERFGDIKS